MELASPVTRVIEQQDKNTEEPKPYCSQFDLTKRIPKEVIEQAKTSILQWGYEGEDDYKTLIEQIRKVVLDGNFSSAIPVAPNTPRNALRIALHSLASPSWQSKSPHVSGIYTSEDVLKQGIGSLQIFPCPSWITSIFIWYSCDHDTSTSIRRCTPFY